MIHFALFAAGHVVSQGKEELIRILDSFNIQVGRAGVSFEREDWKGVNKYKNVTPFLAKVVYFILAVTIYQHTNLSIFINCVICCC